MLTYADMVQALLAMALAFPESTAVMLRMSAAQRLLMLHRASGHYVCSRMLTCAHVCSTTMQGDSDVRFFALCLISRMLTYADVS